MDEEGRRDSVPNSNSAIRPKIVNVNLIPRSQRQSFGALETILLVFAILLGGLVFQRIQVYGAATQAQIGDLQAQIAAQKRLIQAETTRIAAEKPELASVNQEIQRLKNDVAHYATNSGWQVRRQGSLASALQAALTGVPTGLSLTSISWQDPKLILQGSAPDVSLVVTYVGALKASGRFAQVSLQTVNQASAPASGAARTPTPAGASGLTFAVQLELANEGQQ